MTTTEPDVVGAIHSTLRTLDEHQSRLDALGDLIARVDRVLQHQVPTLDAARAACNEAGVHDARRKLADSLTRIETAQAAKRAADEEVRLAAEAESDALIDAEWTLDGHFTTEGNKTFLEWGGEKRSMTADERKAWKAQQARTFGTVLKASAERRAAEQKVAEARDAIVLAEKHHGACRADLEAAIAVLATIRLALTTGGATR